MNEHQLKIKEVYEEIFKNEDEDITEYYGVQYPKYTNIDKYLAKLEDVNDKILVAQKCNNFDKVEELISDINLTEYEKNKYLKLKRKNDEINQTINLKILSEKYSFLDNIMDMITTDIDIQDQILSLSDSRLEVFKKMYSKLQTATDFYNPYIDVILKRIGYASLGGWKNNYHSYDSMLEDIDKLVENGYELTEEEIERLLYILTRKSIGYNIPNYMEFQKFGQEDSLDNIEFQEKLEKAKNNKDIDYLKFAILSEAYGMNLKEAKKICGRYDISNIKLTEENKKTFEMYQTIYQVVNEIDPEVLIELYDEFVKIMHPERDFRRIVIFENDLRKAFAHDLNNQVFKTDNLPYQELDGVKIYDAGTDFKMIVTAIGAYQGDFKDQENYSEYWNSSKIRSHGNCCSLIGNENLSMATIKNIILGFSNMSDNMLLLSGVTDINSTPNSREFNATNNYNQKYTDALSMLHNTRSDYNELVYERRDLNSNPKYYKKNPDYIVFIEEYEDFEKELEKYKDHPNTVKYLLYQKKQQEKFLKESMKAANDFGVPIVKINRETVAKKQIENIKGLLNNFRETKNPKLLSGMISTFESSRVGNTQRNEIIRRKYFSEKLIAKLLDAIRNEIDSIDNHELKVSLYHSLEEAIKEEEKKLKEAKYKRNENQTPGINFADEFEIIKQKLTNLEESKKREEIDKMLSFENDNVKELNQEINNKNMRGSK